LSTISSGANIMPKYSPAAIKLRLI
jgi:hypothetical protein